MIWERKNHPAFRYCGGWGAEVLDGDCSTKTHSGAHLSAHRSHLSFCWDSKEKTAMTVDSIDRGNMRQSSGIINVKGNLDYTCDFMM